MNQKNDLAHVKCKDCGKEYQLKKGTKLVDFQCDCGGDLISDKKFGDYLKDMTDDFKKDFKNDFKLPDNKKKKVVLKDEDAQKVIKYQKEAR